MDVETIGAALRRKLGPLPVWAWAIIGGAIVYLLRSRGYFSGILGGGTKSADALQPSQVPTLAPQPLTPLAPGESVYNPNDGSLTTAPGGGTDVGGGSVPTDNSDVTEAIQALTDAVLGNHTDAKSVNTATPTTHKPTALQRAKKAVSLGSVGPKNRSRLKKAGYTDSQIDYHLKHHSGLGKPRSVKSKPANTQEHGKSSKSSKQEPKAGIHTPTSNSHKPRARSNSHVRTANGGRTTGPNRSTTKTGKARTAVAAAKSTVRQRPRTAIVSRAAPVAHPQSAAHAVAQKKTAAAHAAAAPATRAPSRAPARTVRTPSAPKKRGK